MVVNAPDSPVQAEVVFVVEATSANSAYIGELKTNYIIPTLEYFHGGALDEGGGSGSVYCVVTYRAADCHPGVPTAIFGPFTSPHNVIDTVDKIPFIGGNAESRACITEAFAAALACFDDLGRTDLPMHVLLLCSSPPYSAYAGGLVPPGAPATVEQAARLLGERGVQVSIASARRVPILHALYEHAGGELHQAQQRNYAKDPRHLVLLRGYSLKERPPSPAPPPVPDIQTDVYGQGRGTAVPVRPGTAQFPRPPAAAPVSAMSSVGAVGSVGVSGAGCGRGAPNWLAPPRAPLYANNSALLTQLAQPSYPPPPPAHATQQAGHPRMQGMVGAGTAAGLQRSYIWSGIIEWMEKGKAPGDPQKTIKHLPCQVSASTKDIEPELKCDTWPNKLLMQLMPKQLISNIGGQYLKDSKSVLFHLQPSDSLDALTKLMVNGFAGCVHFSPMLSPPQCDIKVLILLYTPDKNAYLGFIPNNQVTFVDRLRKVIQQQKGQHHAINKQQLPAAVSAAGGMPPTMPTNTLAGGGAMPTAGMSSSGLGAGMSGGMAAVSNVGQLAGPSQPMVQPPMQTHQQGMMIAGAMSNQIPQVGGKGARSVTQLDGLEAARQHNLEKIQHLQQTLEAAHQQEAQFKSQMDIMTHLHAAQQQEQHYKQLEEQRKLQLQQQLQQQLRGAATSHQTRIMHPRNILPSNPGLKHLLQQQPQYRAVGGGPRPSSQPQQFEDVNNYSEFM